MFNSAGKTELSIQKEQICLVTLEAVGLEKGVAREADEHGGRAMGTGQGPSKDLPGKAGL